MLQVQMPVRILNYVRVVEVSYTLQGGRLGWRGLVLPLKRMLLI